MMMTSMMMTSSIMSSSTIRVNSSPTGAPINSDYTTSAVARKVPRVFELAVRRRLTTMLISAQLVWHFRKDLGLPKDGEGDEQLQGDTSAVFGGIQNDHTETDAEA